MGKMLLAYAVVAASCLAAGARAEPFAIPGLSQKPGPAPAASEAGPDLAPGEDTGERQRLASALEILLRTSTGRHLVSQAQRKWKYERPEQVIELFRLGSVSRTDAVLTRHFNPKTGEEQRDRTVQVSIRSGQRLPDLVLDLAHELTHAVADPSWDPYDPGLTADKYVWATLEAPGGEVDAMVSECRVGLELALRFGLSAARCSRYRAPGGKDVVRSRIRRDFYRVGEWYGDVKRKLGREAARFPLLSPVRPMLYSSTGQAPYPMALIREFDELTHAACRNSRKRLETFSGRSPASLLTYQKDTLRFVESRCSQAAALPTARQP